MTRRQLLESMDSEELTLWRARDAVEPLNEAARIEIQIAQLVAMTHNINRRRGGRSRRPAEFVPWLARKLTTASEQQAFFQSLTKRLGGSINGDSSKPSHRDRSKNRRT